MKDPELRQSLSQDNMGEFPAALKPIRGYEEVGRILGISPSVVRKIESRAMRKIVRAMVRWEENESLETVDNE